MPSILVSPLSEIHATIARHKPSHLITLLSPEHMIETPDGVESARHLKLGVNDIVDAAAGTDPPAKIHIDQLLVFSRTWSAEAPLLVHCWAGVSRSMAAAYIILCDRLGPGKEVRIAQELRTRAYYAWPNALMIRLADEALKREGRMIEAVRAIGAGTPVEEGQCKEFTLADL